MQWSLTNSERTNKYREEGINIDSKLELEEALNVIENISSPRSCFYNRVETVVHNLDIASLMANLSSILHTKANVSFLKSWGIIGSITCDSDSFAVIFQAAYKQVLVFRTGTCHDLDMFHVILEF